MNDDLSHLNPKAQEAMLLSEADRIAYIKKDRWIGYSRAKEILAHLEDLLNHPKIDRMPNTLIVARSNNGKTRLMKRFMEFHPADENPGGPAIIVPVLYVQSPPTPDEGRLYDMILLKLCKRFRPTASPKEKLMIVLKELSQISLGMLAIDDINNLLAGSVTKQKQFLNTLKLIGNELKIPIVGLGTADAMRATQSEPQLENRFLPEILPRWNMGIEFRKLVASFEKVIPLRYASDLQSPLIAAKLHAMSEGAIGELSMLLNMAAIKAIRTGAERITPELLGSCGYISASKRKQQVQTI